MIPIVLQAEISSFSLIFVSMQSGLSPSLSKTQRHFHMKWLISTFDYHTKAFIKCIFSDSSNLNISVKLLVNFGLIAVSVASNCANCSIMSDSSTVSGLDWRPSKCLPYRVLTQLCKI